MSGITTIFFDVGNTLLFPDRDVILAPLRERDVHPSLEQWHAIERRTKREFDSKMQNGSADYSFWQLFHGHLLDELNAADAQLHAKLVAATRMSENWNQIRAGTRQVLGSLGTRYRMGVISNADGRIEEVLRKTRIADCFQTITDSGLVGCEKPHPAIFEAALAASHASAEECLYVGDVYSVDYLGATAVGMKAVLFDVSGAYLESGLDRVESLEELENNLSRGRG